MFALFILHPEGPYTLPLIMELSPKRPSSLGLWGPNSTMVVYMDPLGYRSLYQPRLGFLGLLRALAAGLQGVRIC